MASILRIALIAILAAQISSCKDNSKDKELIAILNERLEKLNATTNIATYYNLKELKDKSTEPATAEKAAIWLPKAESISKLSAEIYQWIEQLKEEQLITKSIASELSDKLLKYKAGILNVDEKIKAEFRDNLIFVSNSMDSLLYKNKGTLASFFAELRKQSITAMLSNIQGNIRNTEIKTTTFCKEQVGITCGLGFYDSYSLIVGQSSNSVSPGSEIEITAGIGAFSRVAMPSIHINKKGIPLNENAFSSYKLKTPKKPGVYKVPVEISYTDNNGEKVSQLVTVEYTVTPPCN